MTSDTVQCSLQFSSFLERRGTFHMWILYITNNYPSEKLLFLLHTCFWQITAENDTVGHKSDGRRQENKIWKYQWSPCLVMVLFLPRSLLGQVYISWRLGCHPSELPTLWISTFSPALWILGYFLPTMLNEIRHPWIVHFQLLELLILGQEEFYIPSFYLTIFIC